MTAFVRDHYRCPEGFLDFALGGELSADEGYFQFGRDLTCYGRSSAGTRQSRPDLALSDILKEAVPYGSRTQLPFDPTEVIDNLRLEKYAHADGAPGGSLTLLKDLYYLVRPFTNLSLRRRVQKFHARNWDKRPFPRWPVDTSVEDLCGKLLLLSMQAQGVDEVPFVWFWPNGSRGCLMMTHDVETEAGRDFCPALMDLNDAYGIKSSFQIVPESRYPVSAAFLDSIRARGFAVEIQDFNHDGRLFDNRDEFLRRAKIINQYAKDFGARGFRAAVLYRKPEWFDAFDFSFDMSIPNVAPMDPQRGGCCTVMPYFIGNILELPVTTIQDYTLFHVLGERSIDLWKTQLKMILEKNGLASFIVHPDYVIEEDTRSVYRDLLHHLRDVRQQEGIWCALPAQVDHWWRVRSKLSVVPEGKSWRIAGEGAERATLAYARNVNGKLVYEPAAVGVTV